MISLGIIFFVVFWIADFAGCNWTQVQSFTNGDRPDSGPKLISKAQWREKLGLNYRYKTWTVEQFKALLGEPSHTQTIEAEIEAIWYYECSDGTIQVEMVDPNMNGRRVNIKSINDY